MRVLLLSTAALAALPFCAHAEDAAVDTVIVTATRLPAAPHEVTGARVVDEPELRARAMPFAADVLATVPGVAIARNGAFGGVSAIRIRGASPDKTLVLVDGAPVGDAADPNGAFDPASLQTADLARIEVLSGPQGSLWGSEAIGGVVAFTTRELSGWRLEAEGGSLDTARLFAGAGLSHDDRALSASVAAFRTDGVSKADTGTEKDGFKTVTANLAGRVQLGAVKLDGRVRYTDSDIDIDGFPAPAYELGDTPDRNTSRAWLGQLRAQADAFGLKHAVGYSLYDLHRKNVSDFPAAFDARRQVLRWTGETDRLAVGAERQETRAELSDGTALDLSNTAVFGVIRHQFQRLTLTASARHDDPEAFKARTTGRLAAALDAGHGFTLTASAGTGFKTPTISQAVCAFCFAPPVPLVPEKAEGYDLRLGWRNDRLSAALTAYRLSVRDQIAYQGLRYVNIARTRSEGLEGELDARLTAALRLKLAAAWTDAVDRTTGQSLLRVPDRSGAAALFWEDGPWTAAFTVRAESSQSDTARDGFSRIVRRGFATADLAGSYAVTEQVTLTARVENLADRGFQETFGYNEPGRAVYIGVRLRN
ncbi:TonB-dependent receptor plug domain-containing protein [Phenylobacterium sp.]|uniref:TonB-dependent receptor plug domain-containing protein n=1 Tax=Phenylobacterium sp. TaxID=1871053 RepID=UPI003962E2FA